MKLNKIDMSEKKQPDDDLQDLFPKVLVGLIFLLLVVFISGYNANKNFKNNSKLLADNQAKVEQISTKNKEILAKQKEQEDEIGKLDAQKQSTQFFDKYFNWSTWQEYSKNMNKLNDEYPQLNNSKVVRISAHDVGNGKSPISYYSTESFVTNNNGSTLNLVTQKRNYATKIVTTNWFTISHVENNLLYFDDFTPIQELK